MIDTMPSVQVTDAQLSQFREQGYVLIENALDPFGLGRVRAAYENVQRQTEPAWREMLRSGVIKGGYGHGPDAHTMSGTHEFEGSGVILGHPSCTRAQKKQDGLVGGRTRLARVDLEAIGKGREKRPPRGW